MCEWLELYALDAVTPQERENFEKHLSTCEDCASELPAYQEVALALALTVEPIKPPARLKMRVLAIPAEEEKQSEEKENKGQVLSFRSRAFIAVSSIAASFVLGSILSVYSPLKNDEPAQTYSLEQPGNVLGAIQTASDSSTINKKVNGGQVTLAYSPSLNKGVFYSKDLGELPEGEYYQLWLQNLDGALIPAGYFTEGKDSLVLLEGDIKHSKAMGITIESNPNPKIPTSAPITFITL